MTYSPFTPVQVPNLAPVFAKYGGAGTNRLAALAGLLDMPHANPGLLTPARAFLPPPHRPPPELPPWWADIIPDVTGPRTPEYFNGWGRTPMPWLDQRQWLLPPPFGTTGA